MDTNIVLQKRTRWLFYFYTIIRTLSAGRNRVIPLHYNVIDFVRERHERYGKLFEENMSPDMYSYRFERVMKELEMDHLPHD